MGTPDPFQCKRCGQIWPRDAQHFRSKPNNRDGMSGTCRSCDRIRISAWSAKNPERRRAARLAWGSANPDKVRAQKLRHLAKLKAERGFVPLSDAEKKARRRAAAKAYRQRSVKDRLCERIRKRLHKALGGSVRLGLMREWLGCSTADLVAHLEAQFQPGMTWENRGDWHIDHIRPLASFDLSDPEQVRAASHYTNLQPLWAADNLRKAARLDWAA